MPDVDDIIDSPSPEPEPKDEDIKDETDDSELKDEDGSGVVKKIMSKLGIRKADEPEESDEGEDIPDEFTEAALALGWTEEDVVKFATEGNEGKEFANEELVNMIPYLSGDEPEPKGSQEPDKESQEIKDKKPDEESEAIKKAKEELRKEFQKELAEAKKDREVQQALALQETVDKAFDEANEKFGIFGKTENLPKFPAGPNKGKLIPTSPAYIARNEVFITADALMRAGIPAATAMEKALNAYKGEHLDKEIEKKYVKELKRNEKKLSAKRQGKETQKVYEHEEDRGADVVREAAKKIGVRLDED